MITFTIWDEAGDKTTVKVDSRDVLVWEKTSRSKETYRDLLTEMSMAKFYRVAHISVKRQGIFDGPLKDFEEQYQLDVPVIGIGAAEDDDANDPTQAGVSTET